ncbi:autotransporter domain-containing protein [Planktomarina temperata]|nr:autotransporter domain-containing protein [Planktomarina temperata]
MKDLFHLPVHFSRQFIALCLALLTLFATPASGQFLSDGVTPVNPIPNSNAILLAHIGNCLAEQPVTGLCTTWGDNSGFGAIPSWDVTNVNDFGNAFLNRTTFNGDPIDQRMIRSGMQRFVQRQRLNRQQSNRFRPLDVDGAARFDNGEFRLNGDFFALSSVKEQSAEVVTTGAFNFVSDRDGNFSGYFNGRSSLEVQLSLDMVLGYFLGVEVGRARLSGTFSGRQDSYGLNAGGYVLRSFNDVSYITGFAALGRNKNQLVVSNGTLQVDSDFDSTTLRLGASATGVFRMPRIEIWPELSLSYAKSRVGSQAVAAQAYGLTANNLSLAGGDVEMGQLMFMPQIKWPLGDGRDGAAVANFSLSPRLTCRATRGVGGSRDCGTGGALGYSAASGDGLTLFNATVEFDNVADTKNGSLTFNVEHNF